MNKPTESEVAIRIYSRDSVYSPTQAAVNTLVDSDNAEFKRMSRKVGKLLAFIQTFCMMIVDTLRKKTFPFFTATSQALQLLIVI